MLGLLPKLHLDTGLSTATVVLISVIVIAHLLFLHLQSSKEGLRVGAGVPFEFSIKKFLTILM